MEAVNKANQPVNRQLGAWPAIATGDGKLQHSALVKQNPSTGVFMHQHVEYFGVTGKSSVSTQVFYQTPHLLSGRSELWQDVVR